MADEKKQEGTAAVAEAEDRSPEAAVDAGGELDRESQTEHKPQLSDEERLQGLEPEKLRQIMYDMLLARRFEEKVAEAYALGKIGGFCHLYIGQEAVAIGARASAGTDASTGAGEARGGGAAISASSQFHP